MLATSITIKTATARQTTTNNLFSAMAPPFHSNDDTSSSSTAHSIYRFPPPSSSASSSTNRPLGGLGGGARNGAATTPTTANSETAGVATQATNKKTRFVCSPIPTAAATFLLRRRLLLPTLAVPAIILSVPPLMVSVLSMLAYFANATHGGGYGQRGSLLTIVVTCCVILLSTFLLSKMGRAAIERHAPDEKAKKKALAKSAISLPFWSLVISILAVRYLLYSFSFFASFGGHLGNSSSGGMMSWIWRLVTSTLFWSVKVFGACLGPALGWMMMSILVVLRYTGPFCPIVRCSSTPLRTNPFDAAFQLLGRNFTSKDRFLDMIADWLEKLSAPSGNTKKNDNNTQRGIGMQSSNQMKSTPFMTTMSGPASSNAVKPPVMQPNDGNDGVGKLLNSLVLNSNARYSRPGLLSIFVQVLVNGVGGHMFAQTIILPHLVQLGVQLDTMHDAVSFIIVLSCLLVPVFELFSSIKEAELHYKHYSSVGGALAIGSGKFHLRPVLVGLANDIMQSIFGKSMLGVIVVVPVMTTGIVLLWTHFLSDGTFTLASPSYPAIMQSIFISYLSVALLVSIMAIQDVLTRWAVCAPGMDPDILMFNAPASPKKDAKFLVEDLIIQSLLMGDGTTVENVIAPDRSKSTQSSMIRFKNHQEEEISRNETACATFAEWIQQSSTTSSGKLSDDILRMCILESFGGGGSASSGDKSQANPFYFGDSRHSAAVRKRLDLSAATASAGRQPIVVPIVRALCAFAGGLGDAASKIYCQVDKDGKPFPKDVSAELWKLPPGSLNAAEFAVIAASRFVVMNSVTFDKQGNPAVNASKRHDRLSLLLPCVIQSAYKLRCGINEYAKATANMYEVNLSTYDKSGKGNGLGMFIAEKCTDLCPVLDSCDNSAKMAMKTFVQSGDHTLEDVLLRRKWKEGMRQWLEGLN